MKLSKHEYQTRAVTIIRGIFEAHIEAGKTAGEMFEAAKARAIRSMEVELRAAKAIDFDRFNARYMTDVKADTVFQPIAA